MSELKEWVKNQEVHRRGITMRTTPVTGDRIVVEGELKDERLVEGYHWDGTPRDKGVVHMIRVWLLLGDWPLTILEADAEMPQVPHELCPTTLDSVKKLHGVTITPGFSGHVKELLGGVHGCAHMTSLIAAMGAAALHGYWTEKTREPMPLPESFEEFHGLNYLVGSCRLWAPDGPLLRKMKETFDRLV